MMRPLPERSTTFPEQSDLPLLSPTYCATRNRVLGQIRGDDVPEDAVLRFIEIEITGLELLRANSEEEMSDFSFDSYCEDSFEMGQVRRDARVSLTRRQRVPRRFSCSSIEEDPIRTNPMSGLNGEESSTKAIEYGYGRFARRSSMGSNDNSSAVYSNNGRLSRFIRPVSRRSSLGSYANDSLNEGRQVRMNKRVSRRSSIGSNANDSVDYGYGRQPHGARRSSIGSKAEDSVDYGYGNDSHDDDESLRKHVQNRLRNNRAQPQQQRRFSNYSDFANDSVEVARQNKAKNGLALTSESAHVELKQRRMSLLSMDSSGFAPEVFSTQSINTGGANRAA